MIKTKPLALAQKLKNIVDICEAADTEIENQKLIQKGALDAGKEHDGIEPAVVRKILARRKKLAKDPAETTRLEDLMTDYQFMLGEGREDARPWAQADDEVSRVMALTNTSKPPKIEAIKKALGCSQGKAHKLRSIAAVRLAKKSSSSTDENEHEHSPKPEDGDDGITESCGDATVGGSAVSATRSNGIEGESLSGVAPGPHDTIPSVCAEIAHTEDEAPTTPSVGAVAAEPRVAPQTDLEMPKLPSFLDRRTAQGRGTGSPPAPHPAREQGGFEQ